MRNVNERDSTPRQVPLRNVERPRTDIHKDKLHALLYEALETEQGGVRIYETALKCAINEDLIKEWEEYLDQTRRHVDVLIGVLKKFGMNPDQETPGRNVVRHAGHSLVKTMQVALAAGKPLDAQLVGVECVVQAETKDHMNWELLNVASEYLEGVERDAVKAAVEEVEDEEDEHLYHSKGWARELHLEAIGLPAQLPPAEEEKDVKTELDAAVVGKERKEALTGRKKGNRK